MTGITNVLKTVVGQVVGSTEAIENNLENKDSALADRLGNKIFGATAESKTDNAQIIAPDASTTPVTTGRRSHRPDGEDPFHNNAPSKS